MTDSQWIALGWGAGALIGLILGDIIAALIGTLDKNSKWDFKDIVLWALYGTASGTIAGNYVFFPINIPSENSYDATTIRALLGVLYSTIFGTFAGILVGAIIKSYNYINKFDEKEIKRLGVEDVHASKCTTDRQESTSFDWSRSAPVMHMENFLITHSRKFGDKIKLMFIWAIVGILVALFSGLIVTLFRELTTHDILFWIIFISLLHAFAGFFFGSFGWFANMAQIADTAQDKNNEILDGAKDEFFKTRDKIRKMRDRAYLTLNGDLFGSLYGFSLGPIIAAFFVTNNTDFDEDLFDLFEKTGGIIWELGSTLILPTFILLLLIFLRPFAKDPAGGTPSPKNGDSSGDKAAVNESEESKGEKGVDDKEGKGDENKGDKTKGEE